jgi:hypothetical protein
MKINNDYLFKFFKYAHETKTSVMLRGYHGIGKSLLPHEYAEENDYYIEHQWATGQDPTDLVGLTKDKMVIQGGKEVYIQYWTQPIWLHRLWEQHYANKKTVFLLDELNRANEEIIQMSLSILNDRRIHEHSLPPDCLIITSVNPDTSSSKLYDNIEYNVAYLDKAVYDRVMLLDLEIDTNSWVAWAIKKKVNTKIIQFIKTYEKTLFEPVDGQSNHTTPRSWVYFSRLLDKAELDWNYEIPGDFLLELATSKIGENGAHLFRKFYKENQPFLLETIRKIVSSKDGSVPSSLDFFKITSDTAFREMEYKIQDCPDIVSLKKEHDYIAHVKIKSNLYKDHIKPWADELRIYLIQNDIQADSISNASAIIISQLIKDRYKFSLFDIYPLMVILYSLDLELQVTFITQFKELCEIVNSTLEKKDKQFIFLMDMDDERYIVNQILKASDKAKSEMDQLKRK